MNPRTMRGSTIIYLVAATAFTVPIAHGLQCYVCPSPTPSLECNTTETCAIEETWCFTRVYGPGAYPFNKNQLVVQGCTDQCEASNPYILGVTRPTMCCQSDTCNIASKVPGSKLVTWEALLIGICASTVLQNWG